ncbi:MAG: ABC transporter permease, partial [Ignavibacteria bacterium]|nr:ABC transporter permease [Ignavibacteria bacterium]
MKIPALVMATFRELTAKATLLVLAGISTLIILGILSSVGSNETADGTVLTMFGQPVSPPASTENLAGPIGAMQAGLAGGLFVGIILFGIFATAGIIPDMMEKGTIDLYLSKPIARWELLLGKYLGAVAVILLNIVYFLGAIWLIFGIKVGVWNMQFLLASLSMTFVYASLYSITLILAVVFRNTVIPIIGSFLYLFVLGGILEGRENTLFLISENIMYRGLLNGLYYLLPQISSMQDNIARQIMHQPISWEPFVQSL